MESLRITKFPRVRVREPGFWGKLSFLYRNTTLKILICAKLANALRKDSTIVIIEWDPNKITRAEHKWLEQLYYEGTKYFKVMRESHILPTLEECRSMQRITLDNITIKIVSYELVL